MVTRLTTSDSGFAERLDAFLAARQGEEADVDSAVAAILADVRKRGDEAVIDYTNRFDRLKLTPATMRVTPEEMDAAEKAVAAKALDALKFAADRIRTYHAAFLPKDLDWTDAAGVRLGARFTPIGAVGVYVPGGTAAYPSSVLMNTVPAKLAGVPRVVMVVPSPDGKLNPLVLAAAKLAGADEVYRIGGAQAVAALAFGTKTIRAVDKIVGPGNAYVATAKRQVFGTVGIDMIAGPSEILVVADKDNDPDWIAADLLSQAEHDENAQSILITDDGSFADAVSQSVDNLLKTLPRGKIASQSWKQFGAIVVVRSLDEAPAIVDRIAPEHAELAVADPSSLAKRINNAGALFLGRYTPEAIGDYVAGPNHVLPTSGSARFSSGLSVMDFFKRTSIVACDADSLRAVGAAAMTLADVEGLSAHGLSVGIRLNVGRNG
jgi:histidinol dehydrogenase